MKKGQLHHTEWVGLTTFKCGLRILFFIPLTVLCSPSYSLYFLVFGVIFLAGKPPSLPFHCSWKTANNHQPFFCLVLFPFLPVFIQQLLQPCKFWIFKRQTYYSPFLGHRVCSLIKYLLSLKAEPHWEQTQVSFELHNDM